MNSLAIINKLALGHAGKLAVAAACAVISVGAIADTEWHANSNESGWTFVPQHANKSTLTREKVLRDATLANDFGRGRVSPDGWRYVGGERGWIYEGHRIDYINGKWVHLDGIDKTAAKPSPAMTPAEKKRYDAIYVGG